MTSKPEWQQTGGKLTVPEVMATFRSQRQVQTESEFTEIQIYSVTPDISNSEPTVSNDALLSTKAALAISC